MDTQPKNLRLRISGIETEAPFIRTIHQDIVLNSRSMRHNLHESDLEAAFPDSVGGIKVNISSQSIIISAEPQTTATLTSHKMIAGKEHHLKLGDVETLLLGSVLLRVEVIPSHF